MIPRSRRTIQGCKPARGLAALDPPYKKPKRRRLWIRRVGRVPARQAFLGGRLFDLIEGGSAETSPVYRRRVKLNMAVAVSERSTWRVGAPSQSPVFPQYHRYIISSLESMRKSSPPQLT